VAISQKFKQVPLDGGCFFSNSKWYRVQILSKKNCIFTYDLHGVGHKGEQMRFIKKQKAVKTDAKVLSVVSRYFHGNVRAQLGRIITAQDVERKRKEVTSYVF
jgi:hypothetical protein